MVSGHSTASRQGQSISPLEERGVRGLPRHVEEPHVANAMIEAGTAFRSRCGLCAGRVVSPEPVGHPVGVLRAPRHTVCAPSARRWWSGQREGRLCTAHPRRSAPAVVCPLPDSSPECYPSAPVTSGVVPSQRSFRGISCGPSHCVREPEDYRSHACAETGRLEDRA